MNEYINQQVQICEALKLEQKKHEELVNSIPRDINYLTINCKKVKNSLLSDVRNLDDLKSKTSELINTSKHFILLINYLTEGRGTGGSNNGSSNKNNASSVSASTNILATTTNSNNNNNGINKADPLASFDEIFKQNGALGFSSSGILGNKDIKSVIDISLLDGAKAKPDATTSLISSNYLLTFFQNKLIDFNNKFYQLNNCLNDMELSFNEIEKNSSDLLLSYGFVPNSSAGNGEASAIVSRGDVGYDLNSLINNNLKNLVDSINEEFYLFMGISNTLAELHYEIKQFN